MLYCQMVRKQDTVEIPTVNETSTFDVQQQTATMTMMLKTDDKISEMKR